ncbi:MAG TPA: DUF262 domain-containing protein [Candidatus Kapabacteria bacterium]|nr:DUF262 domain-containing protein [Candidatus Kapabacteria bacterium]
MDVTPDKQNIDSVFSNKTFYIDFYQRQYKWNEDPVKRLLDDIFYKFKEGYEVNKDKDIDLDQLIEKYSWYYLNTYVTNSIDGKLYVVDGQQRLTTLTLILIKLRHLAHTYNSELENWISGKIAGQSGFTKEFWMNHENEKEILQALLENKNLENLKNKDGLTAQNLINNYKVISTWLDGELKDKTIFEHFVFYFLKRVVLIELNVEQTDVPMVFEVINDRGVRLKSYEILKGKLLGQIDKNELENSHLNDIWDKQVEKINKIVDDGIDTFFIYYLRAKFANTIGDSRKYEKNYHRIMFSPELESSLKLSHNPKNVKNFLNNEFIYYSDLYYRLLNLQNFEVKKFQYVYYNGLTQMDSQFLLILSACKLNDEQEDEKIKLISQQVDRLFSLLQLQKSYDSNDFYEMVYLINSEIRKADLNKIKEVFDKYLIKTLSKNRGVQITEPLNYSIFKEVGIELNKRFTRYFFARIEKFIAVNTNMEMKHSMYDLVVNTGTKNGFHIEHILSENKENLKLFGNDSERFDNERNRLGGLLLLKGKDNISSNNEPYTKKLKSYANSLYWNETLREDSYKSKLDFKKMIKKYKLNLHPMNKFGPEELEERQKLLFEIISIIWA